MTAFAAVLPFRSQLACFRRIRGCGAMPALIRALDRHQVDTKMEVA
jgi:hypothetical protein